MSSRQCPLPLAQMTQERPLGESHPPGRTWAQGSLSHKVTSVSPLMVRSLNPGPPERRRRGIGRPLCREGESGHLWIHFKADPSASLGEPQANRRRRSSDSGHAAGGGSGENCGHVAEAHRVGRQAEASLGLELFLRKKTLTLAFIQDVHQSHWERRVERRTPSREGRGQGTVLREKHSPVLEDPSLSPDTAHCPNTCEWAQLDF